MEIKSMKTDSKMNDFVSTKKFPQTHLLMKDNFNFERSHLGRAPDGFSGSYENYGPQIIYNREHTGIRNYPFPMHGVPEYADSNPINIHSEPMIIDPRAEIGHLRYPNLMDQRREHKFSVKEQRFNKSTEKNLVSSGEDKQQNKDKIIEGLTKRVEELEKILKEKEKEKSLGEQKYKLIFQEELEALNRLIKNRDEEIEKLHLRIRELENLPRNKASNRMPESKIEQENNELRNLLFNRDQEIMFLRNNLLRIGYNALEETIGVNFEEKRVAEFYGPQFRRRRSLSGVSELHDRPLGINPAYIDSLYHRPLHPAYQRLPLHAFMDDIYPRDNYIHFENDYLSGTKAYKKSKKNLILARAPDQFTKYEVVGSLKQKKLGKHRSSSPSSSGSKKGKKKHKD